MKLKYDTWILAGRPILRIPNFSKKSIFWRFFRSFFEKSVFFPGPWPAKEVRNVKKPDLWAKNPCPRVPHWFWRKMGTFKYKIGWILAGGLILAQNPNFPKKSIFWRLFRSFFENPYFSQVPSPGPSEIYEIPKVQCWFENWNRKNPHNFKEFFLKVPKTLRFSTFHRWFLNFHRWSPVAPVVSLTVLLRRVFGGTKASRQNY